MSVSAHISAPRRDGRATNQCSVYASGRIDHSRSTIDGPEPPAVVRLSTE